MLGDILECITNLLMLDIIVCCLRLNKAFVCMRATELTNHTNKSVGLLFEIELNCEKKNVSV